MQQKEMLSVDSSYAQGVTPDKVTLSKLEPLSMILPLFIPAQIRYYTDGQCKMVLVPQQKPNNGVPLRLELYKKIKMHYSP